MGSYYNIMCHEIIVITNIANILLYITNLDSFIAFNKYILLEI